MQAQPGTQTVEAAQMARIQTRLTLERQAKSGVDWFFWIAGLSLINTVISLFGGTLTFVMGLGATLVVDVFARLLEKEMTSGGGIIITAISIVIDLVVACIFVAFGLLGRRRHRWAVIIGMILYVLDALIFLAFGDFLPVAFHGLALWGLWGGFRALGALQTLEASQ